MYKEMSKRIMVFGVFRFLKTDFSKTAGLLNPIYCSYCLISNEILLIVNQTILIIVKHHKTFSNFKSYENPIKFVYL